MTRSTCSITLAVLALAGCGFSGVQERDLRASWLAFEYDLASLSSTHQVQAEPLLAENRRAVVRFLQEAASRYPEQFVKERMPSVLVVQSLRDSHRTFGGLFIEPDLVILSVQRADVQAFLLSFHHEICHYMLHHNRHAMSWAGWRNISPRHGAPDGHVSEDEAWQKGFVSAYAMANPDEDVAATWAAAFANESRYRAIPWSEYRILQSKLKLVKEFAMRVHPSFDREYFARTEPFASALEG